MRLLAFLIGSFLILTSFVDKSNAKEISTIDLLNPENSAMHKKADHKRNLSKEARSREEDIYKLLGPKEIFPFLPDNHRDSGTGKFNSF